MSHTFYEAHSAGEEPENDAWVLDFEKWAGLYEVWRDRQKAYGCFDPGGRVGLEAKAIKVKFL